MSALTFRVEAHAGDLTIGEDTFPVGEHEPENPSADLVRAIASAAASGGVTILSGKPSTSHIESDAESEKVLNAAMKDGRWQEGNLLDFIAQKEALLREHKALLKRDSLVGVVPTDPEADLSAADEDEYARASIEQTIKLTQTQIEQAKADLKALGKD